MRLVFGASLSVVKSGDLPADAVQRVAHRLGIDGGDHDAGDAGGDEVVHQAGLDRGRRLLGIFEDEGRSSAVRTAPS